MINTLKIVTIFRKYFPNIDKNYIKEMTRLIELYPEIFKDNKHLSFFLANVIAEIDVGRKGKVRLRENLNYSAKGLLNTFPHEYNVYSALRDGRVSTSLANKINKQKSWRGVRVEQTIKPHKANKLLIGSIAYARRLGNGGEATHDGYFFRGLGSLQVTGKKQFQQLIKNMKEYFEINLTFLYQHMQMIDNVFNNYTMNILSGMAYWLYSGMAGTNTMDETIDIINKHTKSRKKRKKIQKEIYKMLS